MQAKPRRLGRRTSERTFHLPGPAAALTRAAMSLPRQALRKSRAAGRLLLLFAWSLLAIAIQSVIIRLPGRGKIVFARIYWATMCGILGLRVRVLGRCAATAARTGRRPVVYVSNHSSYADILVLGGRLEACFVSKSEVAGWPVIGTIARLGRSVFVSRDRAATVREGRDMQSRLAAGDNLILFPEGTSSDGSRVLPFHSTFFVLAKPPARADAPPVPLDRMPLIQPISVVYDRLGGMPVGRNARPVFAWFGDMNLARHAWRLAQCRGMRATVLLHEPIDPADFPSRKALADAAWVACAEGAAALRQNRPAAPVAVPRPVRTAPAPAPRQPAYA